MDIKRAIENDEFTFHYQPILNLGDLDYYSVELLARWGDISPSYFLKYVKDHQDCNFNRYLFSKALDTAKKLIDVKRWKININLDPVYLICDWVNDLLYKFYDYKQFINIELTEDFTDLDHRHSKILQGLMVDGFNIGLDDYGKGRWRADDLLELDYSFIKFDRRLIRLESNDYFYEFIRFLVSLLKKKGIICVLEGIETESHLVYAKLLEFDCVQGYYFSKPKPVELKF